jgi:hypothetical protein
MTYLPLLRFHTDSSQVGLIVSAVMLVVGLLSLLYGWKLYRVLLVFSVGLAAGCLTWYFLSPHVGQNTALFISAGAGLLGALLAIPIQQTAVFLFGATLGFVSLGPVIADLIWRAPNGPTPTQYLIAGGVAFVAMGIFALLVFRPAMIIATSMFGAALVLAAAVHVIEAFSTGKTNVYGHYPEVMACAFAALMVLGVIVQAMQEKKEKESD